MGSSKLLRLARDRGCPHPDGFRSRRTSKASAPGARCGNREPRNRLVAEPSARKACLRGLAEPVDRMRSPRADMEGIPPADRNGSDSGASPRRRTGTPSGLNPSTASTRIHPPRRLARSPHKPRTTKGQVPETASGNSRAGPALRAAATHRTCSLVRTSSHGIAFITSSGSRVPHSKPSQKGTSTTLPCGRFPHSAEIR